MRRLLARVGLLAPLALTAGCASAAAGPPVIPVPVYSEEDVPCDYEVVERVRIRNPTGAATEEDYLRRLRTAYGEAGARAGADAVIVDIPDRIVGVARRREASASAPPTSAGPPAGQAIRFLPGTCGLLPDA